jgi:hypothetical protein
VPQVARLGLRIQRREPDRSGPPLGDVKPAELRQGVVERAELGVHLLA